MTKAKAAAPAPAPGADKEAADAAEKEAAEKAAADAAEKAAADAAEKAAARKKKFFVCEGCSLTTRRGVLAEGDEITSEDLFGGSDAIKAFVKSGHIEKG